MTDRTDKALLEAAASRATRRPGFLAHDLDAFHTVVGDHAAAWLGVDDEQLSRLALCRTPRRGRHFGNDVLAIANHVGADPVRVATVIRVVDALAELQREDRPSEASSELLSSSLLAAARDEASEHTVLNDSQTPGPGLPGWLHDAVDRFWADSPTTTSYPRDLDFAILVGLPIAVVELPRLSVRSIAEWLTAHKLSLELGEDRRLRACLVALGGVGLVFVDANDDPTQRRVSLAHEAAHFVVEYLLPRQEVARRRPELLAVIDGQRPPTAQEQLSAILGDVPLGVHSHLLGREQPSDRVETAEWRARRVAVELLAPQDVVLLRMSEANISERAAVRKLLVDEFGLPVPLADDYAEQLTLASNARPGFLGILNRPSSGADGAPGGPNRTSEPFTEEEGE